MGGDCFSCAGEPAADPYTLVVDNVGVFEDKSVCEDCLTGFRDVDWIAVRPTTPSADAGDAGQAGNPS